MSLPRALAIARANLVRLLRDRLGLFFILALPLIIVLVLGLQFGGGFGPRVGVVAEGPGALGEELIARLANQEPQGWTIQRFGDEAELTDAIERGRIGTGIVLPPAYEARLGAGDNVEVRVLAPPQDVAIARRSVVEAAVAEQAAVVRAARFAAAETGRDETEARAAAERLRDGLASIGARLETVGERLFPESLVGFSLGAHSQLVLFMFLTSLTGAAQLILSRQLGVSRRMLATPTSISTILVGEALGRFGVGLFQGLFIVAATALAFGVTWGDPLGAAAVIVAFGLVSAGAAMLVGAVASNAEQASSLGVFAGLGIAALGGAMAPPEIFPPIMQTISRLTPHRWAIDGLRELAAGGGLGDILVPLGVLAAFAVVLFSLATWRLHRDLTT